MYNKFYRLNESRWELPEENEYFKYPDYGYKKRDRYNNFENLKEGWDEDIKHELRKFYDLNKQSIVTEYDKLNDYSFYNYIDFSYLTPDELNKMKNKDHIFYYYDEDKTYEVREVIRENPKLNPSDILFSDLYIPSIVKLSKKLSCAIKLYGFKYSNNSLNLRTKDIYFSGSYFLIYCSGISI